MINKILIGLLLITLLWPFACLADNEFRFYDTRHAFLADLSKLKVGYTKEQVEKIMGKYLRGTNWPASGKDITIPDTKRKKFEVDTSKTDQLTLKNCDVYRHSNEGKYDSDWGIVCYQNDLVEYIDFAAD